ncbi:ABC transporter substrate-binding protein [Saliphagus infecundisoli]|uniref:ABC transporter substrate-binding protein n=1 Tax=Saliphagus infecundisoli TaxID=1849069 RepID=A0ABD5QDG5_9EURY|nr:ABC transporter substrate-binding protein [Saliphagus infecundisoli]
MPFSSDRHREVTRRDAVKYGLIGGTVLTAGCLGGNGGNGNGNASGNGNGNGNDSESGGSNVSEDEYADPVEERADRRFTKALHRGTYEIQNASWNPYDPTGEMANFDPPGLIYDPLLIHYQSHDTFQGVIADNWEKEDQSILVELNDDWTWHNGDPVTAHDLKTDRDISFRISEITSPDSPASSYIEDYEVVDDYAIRYHLVDDFTIESVLINELANGLVIIKEDFGDPSYGQWRDDLMDAEGDEATQVVSEFQEWSPSIDEIIGNGPFQISETTDTTFVGEVYEDHPNADNIYFSEYAIESHDDKVLAFNEGNVDAIPFALPASPDVMQQVPDHYRINRDYNHLWSVLFNFGNYDMPASPATNPSHQPITADRRVRQAISCALSRQEIATSVPEQYELYELPPTFLNQTAVDNGRVDIEGYDNYDRDQERATTLMEEAGFERQDGQWIDEDGEQAELILLGQSSVSVQVDGLDSVQYQMEEFGFDVSLNAVDEATYGENRFNGDHDILFDNHPIFSVMGLTYVEAIWEWFLQLNHADYPDGDWEIPAEIGNPDAEETMTINVMDQIQQLHLTGDDEYLANLTWWYNQVLPMYGCVVGRDYGGIQAEDWHVDAPEELLDNRVAEFNLTKVPDAELIPRQE